MHSGCLRLLFLVVFGTLISGCDSTQDWITSDGRTYRVVYRIAGTFPACELVYHNQIAEVETIDRTLPWYVQFDVTVEKPEWFHASIEATCSDSRGREVTVDLIVDGDVVGSDQRNGSNVSIEIERALMADGILPIRPE